jgi:hypothetical protein
MRVIVCENYEEMSKAAARIVAAQIMLKRTVYLACQQVLLQWGCMPSLLK